jgi:hypothetical protein
MKLPRLFGPTLLAGMLTAWSNGPAGNAFTNQPGECNNPPYSTHDWIADHARALLPPAERAWLDPHQTMYLLGTEAPDNDDIPAECDSPNMGYDDRRYGHSVDWNDDHTVMTVTRAALRAQEEYDKAEDAFAAGNAEAAAYYLGAMAHYIGDVSQYGHAYPDEENHGNYETWMKSRTTSFDAGHFESYIQGDNLVRRRPYTAVKRISKATSEGQGDILSAEEMDDLYSQRTQEWRDSIGASLNLGVNELADVLHRFYLNEPVRVGVSKGGDKRGNRQDPIPQRLQVSVG